MKKGEAKEIGDDND